MYFSMEFTNEPLRMDWHMSYLRKTCSNILFLYILTKSKKLSKHCYWYPTIPTAVFFSFTVDLAYLNNHEIEFYSNSQIAILKVTNH